MYDSLFQEVLKVILNAHHVHGAVSIPQEPPKKNVKSIRAIFRQCHNFSCLQRIFPKNTRENNVSDYFCSHLKQEGLINSIPSPDCCNFIAVSKNTHIVHLERHNGRLAIWPYGHYGVKWPYGHMVFMACKVAIKGVLTFCCFFIS